MDKIAVVKKAVTIVVGFGVTKVVSGVIKNNTSPEKVTDQVAIAGASYVIGCVVAARCSEYTDTKIDEFVDFWTRNVTDPFRKDNK